MRVIETVAATAGVSTTDLPPLYDAVDPEALDNFVDTGMAGTSISFEYFDIDVTVTTADDGDVNVRLG